MYRHTNISLYICKYTKKKKLRKPQRKVPFVYNCLYMCDYIPLIPMISFSMSQSRLIFSIVLILILIISAG